MVIDPSSLTGNTLKALQTQHQESLNQITRVLNVKVGDSVTGIVTNVIKASPETRQGLLAIYAEQQKSAPPTLNNSNPQSEQTHGDKQLKLLQSPKLALLEIQVRQQRLLTFTDLPLQKNQAVNLLVKTANQLVLVKPATQPTAQAQAQANSTATAHQALAKQASSPLAQSIQPSTLYDIKVVQQALRTALPQQLTERASITEALNTITLLRQLTNKLGTYSSQSFIPKNVQQALQTVASHLRTSQQLSNPNELKQTLKDSGVGFEAKLQKSILKPSVSQAINASTKHSSTPVTGRDLAQQDLKAALLQLLNKSQPSATKAPEGQSTNFTPTTFSSSPAANLPNPLLNLIKQFLQNPALMGQLKQELPRELVLQQLQQLVQQALGKIQYQQLQTLMRRQVSSPEQTAPNQHWQLEIPVRYGHEVHPMHLRIEDDWVQQEKENSESPQEETQKTRKWLVKLGFDLPEAGRFHAHLVIINNSVNASLWAENPTTFKNTQSQLDTLRTRLSKDGVDVKTLDCYPGSPPKQDNRLSYSLVDIKT